MAISNYFEKIEKMFRRQSRREFGGTWHDIIDTGWSFDNKLYFAFITLEDATEIVYSRGGKVQNTTFPKAGVTIYCADGMTIDDVTAGSIVAYYD